MKRHAKIHALQAKNKKLDEGESSAVSKEKQIKSDNPARDNPLLDVAGSATLTYLMDDQGELIITSAINNEHLPNVIPIEFIMEEQQDA